MNGYAWLVAFYRLHSWGRGRCGWCGGPPGPLCREAFIRNRGWWHHP